ncbi:triose-phosphate transporter family-domain-containing protein [Suillus cothurnatus]|nr:triose-phosphate transporter family-domain-containing protein [Suillus cothurnatus]
MSRFILLCSFWYTTSALSSNTGKTILNQWSHPVTLTIIQFAFVAGYCLLFMSPVIQFTNCVHQLAPFCEAPCPWACSKLAATCSLALPCPKYPSAPSYYQAAYAMLFGVKYSPRTYFSLLPLIIGVMLACTFESASNPTGLLCAFGSALCSSKIMPSGSQTSSHKLDKLNLLFYSSAMAFVLMVPIWCFTDLPLSLPTPFAPHSIPYYFLMNGTVHFAQNIIAFVILSSTSPVTYSIASLIKRVAVICIAIVWFNQNYKRAKSDVERGENKMRRVEATRDMMLPIKSDRGEAIERSSPPTPSLTSTHANLHPDSHGNGHGHPNPHIQISPQDISSIFSKRNTISPTEPYPSPPSLHRLATF